MKRIKTKKLVLTDGTWYYVTRGCGFCNITDDHREAKDFYCERFPELNRKEYLEWELGLIYTLEPEIVVSANKIFGKPVTSLKRQLNSEKTNIDITKFKLKWITVIETIKEEEFNYEGFN